VTEARELGATTCPACHGRAVVEVAAGTVQVRCEAKGPGFDAKGCGRIVPAVVATSPADPGELGHLRARVDEMEAALEAHERRQLQTDILVNTRLVALELAAGIVRRWGEE